MGKNSFAMSLLQGILLGIVQGLTEFLPVSSSGHLVILQSLMNIKESSLAFDALLHLGTLIAVVIYFRAELLLLVRSVWRWAVHRESDRYSRLAFYLVVATLPAAAAGVAFEDWIDEAFQSLTVVGVMLIVTGAILWLSEISEADGKTLEAINIKDSLWVGLAQMAAILPGLSRSGATISAALWQGFDRQEAARFSFLLSVPIIFGAAAVSLKDGLTTAGLANIAVSMAAAAVSGFLAIALLMRLIQEQRLRYFSFYCFIIGSLALALAK